MLTLVCKTFVGGGDLRSSTETWREIYQSISDEGSTTAPLTLYSCNNTENNGIATVAVRTEWNESNLSWKVKSIIFTVHKTHSNFPMSIPAILCFSLTHTVTQHKHMAWPCCYSMDWIRIKWLKVFSGLSTKHDSDIVFMIAKGQIDGRMSKCEAASAKVGRRKETKRRRRGEKGAELTFVFSSLLLLL